MIYKLLPDRYKKWSSLLGGFLIHFSFGSSSMGNLNPYIIVSFDCRQSFILCQFYSTVIMKNSKKISHIYQSLI